MELLQLHYFKTVARLGHMTKAAEELRVAQPALSKTIARLEEDIGVPLFDRRGRKIQLNAIGKAFLKKTEIALRALEEGRKEANDLAGLENGSIYLATSNLKRLSEPLEAFLSSHPEVNFRLNQASMEEMALLIESGEIDFGFTAMPIERPGIRELPVLNVEVFLAVPPGHRFAKRHSISLSEVANEPFVGYKQDYLFQKMNNDFCRKAGFTPNVICEVEEGNDIESLVLAGVGIGFVGLCKGDEESSLVRLHIEKPVCQRTFRLVWHEKRYLSKAAQKFRDFVVHYFAEMQN
ncbi:LysR family transcriptional regulator [Salibacterium halotolerans]|uniref:DNA-binding transcriptional regulator, LysR family n=1 Tax=Salibacterium halotolerans TaxID=1884432 RepID=A0A1I5YE35_9BACI|nr:LysR family transcriptional regulator [Salibacterium halotolerans]SFQ42466.1 DNA-binding transcriptional regulator, LysR family [Salibacterium halotolerans]